MSLYDLLTLIIPGSMVVAVLYIGFYPWINMFIESWLIFVASFGVMYLIGLLLKNWALQKDIRNFDKNIEDIQIAYSNFAEDTDHKLGRKKVMYNDYCADYYYAVDHYSNSKAAILETQVAFLRTMQYTMIVLYYLFLIFSMAYLIKIICAYFCQLDGRLYYEILILNCVGLLVSGHFIKPKYLIKLAHTIQKKVYEGIIYDSFYHEGPIYKRIYPEKSY